MSKDIPSPTAWFSVLESALRHEDYQAARIASDKLRRLGVDVRFRRLDWADNPQQYKRNRSPRKPGDR